MVIQHLTDDDDEQGNGEDEDEEDDNDDEDDEKLVDEIMRRKDVEDHELEDDGPELGDKESLEAGLSGHEDADAAGEDENSKEESQRGLGGLEHRELEKHNADRDHSGLQRQLVACASSSILEGGNLRIHTKKA